MIIEVKVEVELKESSGVSSKATDETPSELQEEQAEVLAQLHAREQLLHGTGLA